MSDVAWSFDYVSINPNITWDVVRANRQYNWSYATSGICHNLDYFRFTIKTVREYDYVIKCLAARNCDAQREAYIARGLRKHFMSSVREELLAVVCHPDNYKRLHIDM